MPSGHRPQPPVGTARVAISGLTPGNNTWVNVFWLNLTATTHVAADLKSIIDSMVASYASRFSRDFSSQASQTGAKASWLYASNAVLEYTGAYSNPGTGGASNATDAVCALIDWSISDYYRGGHPRTYLPPIMNTGLSGSNFLDATRLSNLTADVTGFLNDVNALTHGGISAVALGTVRFASGNAWLSPPVFKPYLSGAPRSRVGIQRRRRGGS